MCGISLFTLSKRCTYFSPLPPPHTNAHLYIYSQYALLEPALIISSISTYPIPLQCITYSQVHAIQVLIPQCTPGAGFDHRWTVGSFISKFPTPLQCITYSLLVHAVQDLKIERAQKICSGHHSTKHGIKSL